MLSETDILYITGFLYIVSRQREISVVLGEKVYDEAAESDNSINPKEKTRIAAHQRVAADATTRRQDGGDFERWMWLDCFPDLSWRRG